MATVTMGQREITVRETIGWVARFLRLKAKEFHDISVWARDITEAAERHPDVIRALDSER